MNSKQDRRPITEVESLISADARRDRQPLTQSELERRLSAIYGDTEATEIMETANASLSGMTPIEVLEAGHHAEVVELLEQAELAARASHGFQRGKEQIHP